MSSSRSNSMPNREMPDSAQRDRARMRLMLMAMESPSELPNSSGNAASAAAATGRPMGASASAPQLPAAAACSNDDTAGANSPMTNLALNLSETGLNSGTPPSLLVDHKRRLSMSSDSLFSGDSPQQQQPSPPFAPPPQSHPQQQPPLSDVTNVRRYTIPELPEVSGAAGIAEPITQAKAMVKDGKMLLAPWQSSRDEENLPVLKRPLPSSPKLVVADDAVVECLETTPVSSHKKRRMEQRSMSAFHIPDKIIRTPPNLQRSTSEQNATILRACSMDEADGLDFTCDKTKLIALPRLKHGIKSPDLRTISAETCAELMRQKYAHKVASYRIIDARYVYEFEGGHLRGAENFGSWDEKAFFNEFLPARATLASFALPATVSDDDALENERGADAAAAAPESPEQMFNKGRNILIFHCEFSSARGPELMRKLKQRDRKMSNYPSLHYPECYLLHNGYKEFYEKFPELCEPCGYQTMKDSQFQKEERLFRAKSKSWAGGTVARTGASSRLLKL